MTYSQTVQQSNSPYQESTTMSLRVQYSTWDLGTLAENWQVLRMCIPGHVQMCKCTAVLSTLFTVFYAKCTIHCLHCTVDGVQCTVQYTMCTRLNLRLPSDIPLWPQLWYSEVWVMYSAAPCSAVQCSAVQCSAVQWAIWAVEPL